MKLCTKCSKTVPGAGEMAVGNVTFGWPASCGYAFTVGVANDGQTSRAALIMGSTPPTEDACIGEILLLVTGMSGTNGAAAAAT